MCKNPPLECKLAPDQMVMEDNNDGTEHEDDQRESTDSESYYTETSSDNGSESESDTESASGNRVTPDMVFYLMLKERGLITEEKYNEIAEICKENIESFIPALPRSGSNNTLDYMKDHSGSEDNMNTGEESFQTLFAEFMNNDDNSKDEEKVGAEVLENNENVAKVIIEPDGHDVKQEPRKEQPKTDKLHQQKEEVLSKKMGYDEAFNESNIQEHNLFENKNNYSEIEIHKHEASDILQQQCKVICENKEFAEGKLTVYEESLKSETIHESQSLGEQCNTIREKNDNVFNKNDVVLGENSIEINNYKIPGKTDDGNTSTENVDTKENSKRVDRKNEPNPGGNKETKSFKDILGKLVNDGGSIEEIEERLSDEYAAILETYVSSLDDFYDKNRAVHLFNEENDDLVEFALFLNFYSPSSYKYVTETFNTPLPDHRVLCSWYLKDSDKPGLTARAFKILKQKASRKRPTCALMFGDLFLRNLGLDYDQVDYGGGCNYEYTDKAVMVYVFLLVSLDDDWKLPLGYIFVKHIPAETQAEFIRICLSLCHDAGADVVAVTLETPSPAEFLGCSFQDVKNLKTTFKHPDCDREVAVWIDPCLALKSVRHMLSQKVLKDGSGHKISWNLIRKLRKLYCEEDDTIDIDWPGVYELRNHIAKVGLTTEIFSKSLAPALELGEKFMPDLFRDAAPTRKFIEIINEVYDILNSRETTNLDDFEHNLNSAAAYMNDIFSNEENELSRFDRYNHTPDKINFKYGYRNFVEGEPACGFIAFLICIQSIKHLHCTLVQEQRLKSIDPQRLCKVQVEDFINNLRAYSWVDPANFCGSYFQVFYDGLFDCIEKNPHGSDQNLALEHWPLENRYHPVATIKLTSGKRSYDDIYSAEYRLKKRRKTCHEARATAQVRKYSKAMDDEADLSIRKNMVGYLAGWIAGKFAKSLKCEECIDALCTDKKLWFHKFITSKDVLGMCLPSEEVFRICWECERALKLEGSVRRLKVWVLRRLAPRFPWSSHRARHHHTHYVHLARAVIAKYIPLRVAVPLSSKDRQRIIDRFKIFSFMTHIVREDEVRAMQD